MVQVSSYLIEALVGLHTCKPPGSARRSPIFSNVKLFDKRGIGSQIPLRFTLDHQQNQCLFSERVASGGPR